MINDEKKEKKVFHEDSKKMEKISEKIIHSLPVAFCVIDFHNSIVETNEQFRKLTGYEKIDVRGLEIEKLFLEKESLSDFLRKAGKQNKKRRKFTLVSQNMKTRAVRLSISSINEKNKKNNFLITVTDAEEAVRTRKKLKRKLKEKDRKIRKKTKEMSDSRTAMINILEDVDQSYQEAENERIKTTAIIKNLIDGVFFLNEEKRFSMVNSKVEEFFEFDKDKIMNEEIDNVADREDVGRLNRVIELIRDEDSQEIMDLYRKELQMDEDFYLEVTTSTIQRKGKKMGTLVHVHDISREKRVERIKSEFVSVAAHQLRTPLSGIKWTLETILEESEEGKGGLNEEERELIEKAYDANERMVNLVNDLLNVSRIEEGRYVYDTGITDISKALDSVIEEYSNKIEENEKLSFVIQKPERRLPNVEADVEKIEIVLQNFLDNAIKYTDEGDIILSFEALKNEHLKVSVTDEGIGIPKDQQKDLFNKFFRAENVVKKDVEGSGLGLFISKNIIKAHGGEIGLESTEGEGSTFYFTLPIKKDFAPQQG